MMLHHVKRRLKMDKYTFATRSGKAYYCNSIPGFVIDRPGEIISALIEHSFEISKEQELAWRNQIGELQSRLQSAGMTGDIIFEYDIVRLGKRIDVILLIKHMVFSIEFKNGKDAFTARDAQQAEDYALDIKNFHKESEDLYVCPILVATDAKPYNKKQLIGAYPDKQVYLQRENIESLVPKLNEIASTFGDDTLLNFEKWFHSPYFPTPTIIAAAVEAYRSHDLTEIANSEAGQEGVESCEKTIYELIDKAREEKRKIVCFVTGVPGAGKTLVGLDVVARNLKKGVKDLTVYISGNGPLVEVLKAALVKSAQEEQINSNTKRPKNEIEAAVLALIQSSYGFKKANAKSSKATAEHVLIFDEAQRVWNQKKMAQKHSDPEMCVSEPHLLYSIMDRHDDWAVMVCLVGLGQDIYDGEVGINEWFRCGIEEFKNWEMYYSSDIFTQTEDKSIDREIILNCPRCHSVPSLHLNTSIRSFRSNIQSKFVDAILENNSQEATLLYQQLHEKYPVYLTRDIKTAKKWVKSQVRGSQRSGVLACSSAQRLKPEGIYVPTEIDVVNWFLAPPDDLRSSNMLEIVASEFKVQGLEIDWSVVCWDADLRRSADRKSWEFYKFRGSKWENRKQEEQKRYLLNSYRVLLTRARQGMVIFVPNGVDGDEDRTRDHSFYDPIYDYLKSCGIRELDSSISNT